jgi:hypothetical protein
VSNLCQWCAVEDNPLPSHRERTIETAPFATLRSGSLLRQYAQILRHDRSEHSDGLTHQCYPPAEYLNASFHPHVDYNRQLASRGSRRHHRGTRLGKR